MHVFYRSLVLPALLGFALSLHGQTPAAARWYALANEIRSLSLGPTLPEVLSCEREIANSAARVRSAPTEADRARAETELQVWRQRRAVGITNLANVSQRQSALFAQLREFALPGFVAHCDHYAGRIAGHDWRRLNAALERELGDAARQSLRAEEAFLRSVIARLENARLLNELRPNTQSVARWQERLAANERDREYRRGLWHYEGKAPGIDVRVNHKQCLQFLALITATNIRIAKYELEWDESADSQRTIDRFVERLADIQRQLHTVVAELNASREAQQAVLYQQASALSDEIQFMEKLLEDRRQPLTLKATRAVQTDLEDAHGRRDGILAETSRLKTSMWKVNDPPRH